MRVIICGDRKWTDKEKMEQVIFELFIKYDELIIIQGEAQGADLMAKSIAINRNFEHEDYKAQWHYYGRSAGPIRNKLMITEGKPNLVIAFHNNIENSKGTKDMIRQAIKNSIKHI